MDILNYLPEFKIIEMNRSTGLVIGHVLSQNLAGSDLAKTTKGEYNFIENGLIVGLSNDRTIENYDEEKHALPFVIFNEELNTLFDGLKYYAQEVETETYPRAIALYAGDVFTTNNYSGVLSETTLFAKVVNGVLTLETAYSDYSLFAVEQSTLPAGGVAGRFIYLGTNESQISGIWDEITFDLNGGTWDRSTDDVVVMGIQGNKISDYELDPIPTYADHYFNGWFTDAECTTLLNPAAILTQDITLYAGWLELFDVIYSGNEGTIDGEASEIIQDVVEGTLVGSAYGDTPAPIRSYYTWASPYWSDSDADPWDDAAATAVEADRTVYAVWYPITYPINYVLPDGAINGENPEDYTVETDTFVLLDATKDNYTFVGWYTDQFFTPGNEVTEIPLGSHGTMTLYARFDPRVYTITYNLDGGVNDPLNPATYTVVTETFVLLDATRGTDTFIGWYTEPAFENEVTEITLGTVGNIELYARFQI